MQDNKVTKDLIRLYNSIINMPDNKERALRIRDFIGILNYCRKIGYITYEEFNNMYNSIDQTKYKHYVKKHLESTRNELIDNKIELINLFGDLLRTFYKCNRKNEKRTRVNEDQVMITMTKFFYWLDPKIFKMFKEMAKNKEIVYADINNCGGSTTNSQFSLNTSHVIVKREQDHMYYNVALVHEIGHAYGNKVTKNIHSFLAKDLFCEFPSILFEELYRRYLQENHIYIDEIRQENKEALLVRYITLLKARFSLSCLYIKDKEFKGLKINPNISIKKLNDLSMKIDGLIIKDKNDIDLYNCMYILGFIFASYFVDRIFENKEEGLKEARDFMCRTKTDSLKNILRDYPTVMYHAKENIVKAYYNDFEYRNGYTIKKRV